MTWGQWTRGKRWNYYYVSGKHSYRKGGHTLEQVALLWNLHPWSYSRLAWKRPQLTLKLYLTTKSALLWQGLDEMTARGSFQAKLFYDLTSFSIPHSGFHNNFEIDRGSLSCGKLSHLFYSRQQEAWHQPEENKSSFSSIPKILVHF